MRRPSPISKDPEERRLGRLMASYTSPSHNCFNPEFKKWVDENCPTTYNPAEKVKLIKEFMRINGRRPSQTSKNPEEKRLGALMTAYISPSRPGFNLEFKRWVDENYPSTCNPTEKVRILKEFMRINGRRPSQTSKNLEEKRLGVILASYISPSKRCLNPEFKKWVDENCPTTKAKRGVV